LTCQWFFLQTEHDDPPKAQYLPAMILLLLACVKDAPTNDTGDISVDLAPIAKNTAEFPADQIETLNTVVGVSGSTDWVHGKGYVHADIESTWLAFQDPLVLLDRRMVSEYEIEWDNRPEYAVSFRTSNVVPNVVTIEFDVDWWQDRVSDERIAGRYAKVNGTPFISRMEGGFLLAAVSENVTSIEIIGELEAAQRGTDPLVSYWTDVYGDALATVHGEDLPELD
jgi:hypothetical protein